MVTRPLTAAETALARRVFGAAIDYDRVTISDGPFLPGHRRGTGMAPNGRLYMYGCYHDDYAAGSSLTQSHFIHEMAHVWQYQNRILDPIADFFKLGLRYKFDYNAAYRYELSAAKDLLDYNMEQQATIVQDYFLRQVCGADADTRLCQNQGGCAANTDLMKTVLARFIADPGYGRKEPPRTKPPAPGA
jgi:hypothetical protein